jgi:hypothetical protein
MNRVLGYIGVDFGARHIIPLWVTRFQKILNTANVTGDVIHCSLICHTLEILVCLSHTGHQLRESNVR